MINLPMILTEEYTLNPAVRSFAPPRLKFRRMEKVPRSYTIATKKVQFGATEGPRYYTIATINVTFGAANGKTKALRQASYLERRDRQLFTESHIDRSRTPGFARGARCGA